MNARRTTRISAAVVVALLALGGCSNLNNQQERALSGGALGAGLGVAAGALTGGSWIAGGILGGAAGAAIGAFTSDRQVKVDP